MLKDNEQVYDDQISPLMTKIIQICKDNNMPMFATFAYQQDQICTTSLPPSKIGAEDEQFESIVNKLFNLVYKSPEVFAFTITSNKPT